MRTFLVGVLAAVCSWPLLAAEEEAHRFGEWPALSAVIFDKQQKNLNLDSADFLIEIWFKPLTPSKHGAGDTLVAKKTGNRLPGYALSFRNAEVALTVCDQKMAPDKDLSHSANLGLKENEWACVAVGYNHAQQRAIFYAGGKRMSEWKELQLGDLSNHDAFCVSYFENRKNSQAHCAIRELRVWKLPGGLPENLDNILAQHAQIPGKISGELLKGSSYSRWTFSTSNDDITDQGNNGNMLVYTPWHYQEEKIEPFPETPAGRHYYVSLNDPKAADDGEGTVEQPFKTIARGARAANAGDVLHIRAGLYRETLYPKAGENGKPVTILGEEGAIICGSDPLGGWEPADEGQWRVANWKGPYCGPMDPQGPGDDANPTHLLLIDDYPLDYVRTKAELVPGAWNLEPVLGHDPKTITICPLPGVDPTKAVVEITSDRGGLMANKFTHVKGLRFLRCGVSLNGMGNVFENNIVEWLPVCCLNADGQYQTVRGNKIRWGGNSGAGASCYKLLFENNQLSYNGWRNHHLGGHGGGLKFIPSNIDHVMRHNEFFCNKIAAIWYDTNNQGNLFEGNDFHDNDSSGIFDEFCFGNTMRNNLAYNNSGALQICNSSEDRACHNICYNNSASGLFFRWDAPLGGLNTPEKCKELKEEYEPKFNVRRYQGMIPYEREKRFRDAVECYTWRHIDGTSTAKNDIVENVFFENGGAWGGQEINQPVPYVKDKKVDQALVNTFSKNIYFNSRGPKIFSNGSYCTRDLTLREWQELSGQDGDSVWMNPFENWEKMPAWFKERFPFKKDDFRPLDQVDAEVVALKATIAKTVLRSRLVRSKRLEKIAFADPLLSGLAFDFEGKRCAAVWSKTSGMRDFRLPGTEHVTLENKFLQRKESALQEGQLSLFVTDTPLTLLGLEKEILEDRGVFVEVPARTEPGKPVAAKLLLENSDAREKAYALKLAVQDGWKITGDTAQVTLQPGEKKELPVTMVPPPEAGEGVFALKLKGAAGNRTISLTRNFGIGALLVLKTAHSPQIDGNLKSWTGTPNGLADKKEQVVAGKDAWNGPQDLSAKVWLGWCEERELFFAIDVADGKLAAAPSQPGYVELFVDVRPFCKQDNKYSPGVFKLALLPGTGGAQASFKYEGVHFGDVRTIASQKTAKGYRLEMDLHFHTGEVEDPGWAANREVRLGVLVHGSGDPADKAAKIIGVWHTEADAGENLSSLTTFVTEK